MAALTGVNTAKAVTTTPPSHEKQIESKGQLEGRELKKLSSSDLKLRVMLAILEWIDSCNTVQKDLETEQEAAKTKHWKAVKTCESKMLEGRHLIFALSVIGAGIGGLGAGIGYRTQSMEVGDTMALFGREFSRDTLNTIAGYCSGLSQVPDRYGDGIIRQSRDAEVETLRAEVTRAEKKSQAPSNKSQKSERNEDAAQSFIKQLIQQDGQVAEAICNMLRGH
jgi:hypothetical protein